MDSVPSRTKSHLLPGHSPPASQAGRRVGPALKPSASLGLTSNAMGDMAVGKTAPVPNQDFFHNYNCQHWYRIRHMYCKWKDVKNGQKNVYFHLKYEATRPPSPPPSW